MGIILLYLNVTISICVIIYVLVVFTDEMFPMLKNKLNTLLNNGYFYLVLAAICTILFIVYSHVWVKYVTVTIVPNAFNTTQNHTAVHTDTVAKVLDSIKTNRNPKLDEGAGARGDTFGGTLSPLIAWLAAVITFGAFWVQYKANKQQRDDLREERTENVFYMYINNQRDNVAQMRYADPKREGDKTNPKNNDVEKNEESDDKGQQV